MTSSCHDKFANTPSVTEIMYIKCKQLRWLITIEKPKKIPYLRIFSITPCQRPIKPRCFRGYFSPKMNCVQYQHILRNLSKVTLLVLGTEYSLSGNQYHACWCPGSLSRQGISGHGIDSIRQAACRIVGLPRLTKISDMIRNVNNV